MLMTPALAALLDALSESIILLERASGEGFASLVAPILLRRRRALSRVRTELRISGVHFRARHGAAVPFASPSILLAVRVCDTRLLGRLDALLEGREVEPRLVPVLAGYRAEVADAILSYDRSLRADRSAVRPRTTDRAAAG